MEDFSKELPNRQLARSLFGCKIENAVVIERNHTCFLQLKLDDGRMVEVGVSGNLHDEAYFHFKRSA